MTVKSVIDIEVNDEKFQRFYELFSSYDEKLKGLPESIRTIGEDAAKNTEAFIKTAIETNKSVKNIEDMTAALVAAKKAQGDLGTATRSSGGGMKKMADDAERLGRSIFGIGKFLLKAGAWGFGGASAAFFGLDMLGRSAVGSQRSARGAGVSVGQQKAFNLDFSRFVDPSTLSNVANAQNDLTKQAYLALASGVSIGQAQTANPAQLAIQSAVRLHDWWNQTPPGLRSSQTMAAGGFSQIGYSLEDARRLGATSRKELMLAQEQYQVDQKTLSITDQSVSKWYEFTRQLSLAGKEIETVLIDKLQELGPSLGKLSAAFAKDIEALINNVSAGDIAKFASGIKGFAEYISSPEMMKNIRDFGEAVSDVSQGILGVVKWFKSFDFTDKTEATAPLPGNVPQSLMGSDAGNEYSNSKWRAYKTPDLSDLPPSLYPKFTQGQKEARVSALERRYGLPQGVLGSVWQQESSRGANVGASLVGAMGEFQFMPKTAKSMSVNPMDFSQASSGAARLLQEDLKMYKGDLRKALAAYNWRPSALNADIARNQDKWEDHLPYETKNYINQIVSRLKIPQVNVTITNKTGASMYTTANALAH